MATRAWTAPIGPLARPVRALLARGLVALALVLLGAGVMMAVNWWHSPKHQIQFATDAATHNPSERQTQADNALGQALQATSSESAAAGTCPRDVCYVSICRTYFRVGDRVRGQTLELQTRTEACVEAWVRPVVTTPGGIWPSRIAWRGVDWRWSVETGRGDKRVDRVSGTWYDFDRVPKVDGKPVLAAYLEALAADMEAGMRSELGGQP